MEAMIAEFYGKVTGANKGVAGSMELADHDIHFHSGAIVGGAAGLAVGHAFAQKFLREEAISIAVFGDGAMDEGVNYEAINLAVLHDLPVIFLCENNAYAAHTSLSRRSRAPSNIWPSGGLRHQRRPSWRWRPRAIADGSRSPGRRSPRAAPAAVPGNRDLSFLRPCRAGRRGLDGLPPHRGSGRASRRGSTRLAAPCSRSDRFTTCGRANRGRNRVGNRIPRSPRPKRLPFPHVASSGSIASATGYDRAAVYLIEGAVSEFQGAQSETKLGPY